MVRDVFHARITGLSASENKAFQFRQLFEVLEACIADLSGCNIKICQILQPLEVFEVYVRLLLCLFGTLVPSYEMATCAQSKFGEFADPHQKNRPLSRRPERRCDYGTKTASMWTRKCGEGMISAYADRFQL